MFFYVCFYSFTQCCACVTCHTQAPDPTGFRADMLGQFVWKYSDDGGQTWSPRHYEIPVPERYIDRVNTWNGSVQIMWQVDHMKVVNGSVYFAFTKIGTYVPCFFLIFISCSSIILSDIFCEPESECG